jgi:hypothetical protein
MIDADEAQTLAQAAAETDEALAKEEALAAAVARKQARREAAERARIATEMERRPGERLAAAAKDDPEAAPSAVEETLQQAPATVTNLGPRAAEEAAGGNGQRDPKEETQARKALVKADRQAAKESARRIAALEKKEARERKALAKAAARRRTA